MKTLIHPEAGFHTPFIAGSRDEVIFMCLKRLTQQRCDLQFIGSHHSFHTLF
jgi:hypothetical protein